jgi:hypothetical protein
LTIPEILVCRDRWLDNITKDHSPDEATWEALPKCRAAILELESRLRGQGYPIRSFIRLVPVDLDRRLEEIEAATGILIPPIVRAFWRVVGGVSFVDLQQYRHIDFWSVRGVRGAHGFCDGFHVDLPDEEWLDYTLEDYESYAAGEDEGSFRYSLAPDGYHKDDISGGPPYAVGRSSAWAPVWENFSWSGYRRPETAAADPTDFLSYVRTALLECAGFPGLLGHPGFEPLRRRLVDGLVSF